MKARIYTRCAYTNYANANRYQLKVFEWLSKLPYQPGVLWTPSVERSKFNGPSESLSSRYRVDEKKEREGEYANAAMYCARRQKRAIVEKKPYRAGGNPRPSFLSFSLSLSSPPSFFHATAIYASGVICVVHKKRFEFFRIGSPRTARENARDVARDRQRKFFSQRGKERKKTTTLFIPQKAVRRRIKSWKRGERLGERARSYC